MESGVDCRGRAWTRNDTKMSPDKDLTGRQIEYLSVLFRVENTKAGDSMWLCECRCGNQIVVKGSSLRSNHSGSCGCRQRETASKLFRYDIEPGTQFTYLTVLKRAEGYMGKGSYWHVRCKCGTEKIVGAQALRSGVTTSCGCRVRELNSFRQTVDIVGKKRGLLTIVKGPVDKRNGELYWEALCDCGKTVVVNGHSFKRGDTTSCGCASSSAGETLIASLLDNANIHYEKEYSFSDLLGDAGCRLRYDFAIIGNEGKVTRLLEFDGAQHYRPSTFFGGMDTFERLQRYDSIKNEYAKNHNIPLVRIPYNKLYGLCLNDLYSEEFLVA